MGALRNLFSCFRADGLPQEVAEAPSASKCRGVSAVGAGTSGTDIGGRSRSRNNQCSDSGGSEARPGSADLESPFIGHGRPPEEEPPLSGLLFPEVGRCATILDDAPPRLATERSLLEAPSTHGLVRADTAGTPRPELLMMMASNSFTVMSRASWADTGMLSLGSRSTMLSQGPPSLTAGDAGTGRRTSDDGHSRSMVSLKLQGLAQLLAAVSEPVWVAQGAGGAVLKAQWRSGCTVAVKWVVTSAVDVPAAYMEALVGKMLAHPYLVQTFDYAMCQLDEGALGAGQQAGKGSGRNSSDDGAIRCWNVMQQPPQLPCGQAAARTKDWLCCETSGSGGEQCQPLSALAHEAAADVDAGGRAVAMDSFDRGTGCSGPQQPPRPVDSLDLLRQLGAAPGKFVVQIVSEWCDEGTLHTAIRKGVFRPHGTRSATWALRALLRTAREVYSFGVLLWHMYTGKMPFAGHHEAQVAVGVMLGNLQLEWPAGMPPPLLRLGQACCRHEPERRPTVELLQQLGGAPGKFVVQIVSEWCDEGTLHAAIRLGMFRPHGDRSAAWALRALLRTAREVALGMCHLHSLNIIHGDLKPGNVLLKSSRVDARGFVAKVIAEQCAPVADFGLSRLCGAAQEFVPTSEWGTVPYMAGEYHDNRLCRSSDVYSFGVLLWHMYTGKTPFAGHHEARVAVGVMLGDLQLEWPAGMPPPLLRIGQACCRHEPERRPTFKRSQRRHNGGLSSESLGYTPPVRTYDGGACKGYTPPVRTGGGDASKGYTPPVRTGGGDASKGYTPPVRTGGGDASKGYTPPVRTGGGDSSKSYTPPVRTGGGDSSKGYTPLVRTGGGDSSKGYTPPVRTGGGDSSKGYTPPVRTGGGDSSKGYTPLVRTGGGDSSKGYTPPVRTGGGDSSKGYTPLVDCGGSADGSGGGGHSPSHGGETGGTWHTLTLGPGTDGSASTELLPLWVPGASEAAAEPPPEAADPASVSDKEITDTSAPSPFTAAAVALAAAALPSGGEAPRWVAASKTYAAARDSYRGTLSASRLHLRTACGDAEPVAAVAAPPWQLLAAQGVAAAIVPCGEAAGAAGLEDFRLHPASGLGTGGGGGASTMAQYFHGGLYSAAAGPLAPLQEAAEGPNSTAD
ncbi:Mitogen-activated protein kinase kinase kinase 10, partial [Tetrabaena socialis]